MHSLFHSAWKSGHRGKTGRINNEGKCTYENRRLRVHAEWDAKLKVWWHRASSKNEARLAKLEAQLQDLPKGVYVTLACGAAHALTVTQSNNSGLALEHLATSKWKFGRPSWLIHIDTDELLLQSWLPQSVPG